MFLGEMSDFSCLAELSIESKNYTYLFLQNKQMKHNLTKTEL